jgi:TolB-like protein
MADATTPGSPKEPDSTDPARVFISYASADKLTADAVCAALETTGIPCWIAPRDVKPGALYADAIVRAITTAKAVVLILSKSSIASSHVGKEVERASSKKRAIIALRLDAAPLIPALEYFLSESQWIDATATNWDSAYAKLIDAIRDPQGHAPVSANSVGAIAAVSPKSKQSRTLLIAAITVAALAITAFIVTQIVPRRHAAAEIPAIAPHSLGENSIAVLPFADLSEKKDQGYFADGIAEELLDRLAQVPDLRVIGRASSFRFKGKNDDPTTIGAALHVAYLLEGSVKKEGLRVRITAQLVEARTSLQRWSNHLESDVGDVLQVQDTIAAELARALQIAVQVDTQPGTYAKSPEVIDAYLRGLQSFDRETKDSCEAAIAYFQRALTLDSTFAPAAIGLAQTYVVIGSEGWLPPNIAFERARDAAILAQRLDPKKSSPHVSMAQIHVVYDWDWDGADRELQQAFALGPRETNGLQVASFLAAARGKWDDARQLAIESIALDPLSADALQSLGWAVYLRTGKFVEAEQTLRRSLQISPQAGSVHFFLGEALMLQGHLDAALAEFQKETLDDGQLEGSAMVLYSTEHKVESDAKLAQAIRQNGTSWPSEIARVYAYRGDKDHAFEWLDKAFAMRDEDLYFIKGDPLLKNLERDPRYKAFLRKMNLPE